MQKIQKDQRRVGLLVDPYSMAMHSRFKKKEMNKLPMTVKMENLLNICLSL